MGFQDIVAGLPKEIQGMANLNGSGFPWGDCNTSAEEVTEWCVETAWSTELFVGLESGSSLSAFLCMAMALRKWRRKKFSFVSLTDCEYLLTSNSPNRPRINPDSIEDQSLRGWYALMEVKESLICDDRRRCGGVCSLSEVAG